MTPLATSILCRGCNIFYVPAVPLAAIHTEITGEAAPVIGEGYTLMCNVTKSISGLLNTPKAQWFDNKGQPGDLAEGQSTFTFSPLKTAHAGSYKCKGSYNSSAIPPKIFVNDTWNLTVIRKLLHHHYKMPKNYLYYNIYLHFLPTKFVSLFHITQYQIPQSHWRGTTMAHC